MPATSPVRLLKTWVAPSCSASSSFSGEPAVASTVAPASTASWIAATDTPLPAAWISTVSPALSPPTGNSACDAVRKQVGNVAACSIAMSSGTAVDVAGGSDAPLGVPAGDRAADHAEFAVEVAHPSELRALVDTGERRVDDHPVADGRRL